MDITHQVEFTVQVTLTEDGKYSKKKKKKNINLMANIKCY